MAKVQIYTSNTCGYCHMAKDFFEENNIEYTELNVSENVEARKELMKKVYMSVPVIIVGEEEILGFDKDRIVQILGI